MSEKVEVLDTVPMVQKHELVEGQMWKTLSKLAETEGNIYLLSTLKSKGLATNDVRNFTIKQTVHKRVNKDVDARVKRCAMQSKLVDALAHAKRLRQSKNTLRKRVMKKYSKSKGKEMMREMMDKYRQMKISEIEAAKNKVLHMQEKESTETVMKEVPEDMKPLLNGVNIFSPDSSNLRPEPPTGLKIFDKSLKFNEDELSILAKGPKFMVRGELDSEDFDVELEKMVVKEKFNNMNQDKDDCSVENSANIGKTPAHNCEGDSVGHGRLNNVSENHVGNYDLDYLWEENSGSMVYNSRTKTLDMGNLRATSYKYNKEIYMPKAESLKSESNHENRRNEMRAVFNKVKADKSIESDSNLTPGELRGIKSLKKRISDGKLIIAESDKSKLFCALTPEQYIKAGSVHTSKDREISHDQIKRVQNVVNDHTWWLAKITNCGSNWGHESRINKNISDKGEQTCEMSLLIKDHKPYDIESDEPLPTRPVVSGNSGLNRHLSEILSLLLEPVVMESDGNDIDSTSEMLCKLDELNAKLVDDPTLLKTPVSNNKDLDETHVTDIGNGMCKDAENSSLPAKPAENSSLPAKHDNKSSLPAKPCNSSSKTFNKNDIRSYGKHGISTNVKTTDQVRKQLRDRVEFLRDRRTGGSLLPNITDRLEASRLVDKIEEGEPIRILKTDKKTRGKMQKDGLSIVGADVRSLFPSLLNLETARLAKHAIMKTSVDFSNFDHKRALRYIFIVGGLDLLKSVGLERLAPKWKGDRSDLVAVGGKKSKSEDGWRDTHRDLHDQDKKKIVALTVEIAVNVIMCSHIYHFCGKYYLQINGGPIGLVSTATLAALVMKLWDKAWVDLLDREGLILLLYFRYVDDSRTFLSPLAEGWRWHVNQFEFRDVWQQEDLTSGKSDQERTTEELIKAMSHLVSFLEFEGEESGMFGDGKLPTLDASIWWDGCEIKYQFFEKKMCPNLVLQKDTALSPTSVRASLTQETVRRLLNCSVTLPVEDKQVILSKFAQKLLNSGHSIASSRYILVHGVMKYVEMLRKSSLPEKHSDYKPLHFDKFYKRDERKIKKFLAVSSWYSNTCETKGPSWRSLLPYSWRGDKPIQFRLPGMNFSTILQVPSSKDSRLLRALSRIEPRLAKNTSYHVKLVERGGQPLSRFFPKNLSSGKCEREDCKVCINPNIKGPSFCKVGNVVYECVCALCDEIHKVDPKTPHKGRYIGESYRSLYERSIEHFNMLKNLDLSSFMYKHWAISHKSLANPPEFRFRVVKKHRDPLSRLIHEAVRIMSSASMNSKTEWGGFKIARLSVEPAEWEKRKQDALELEKAKAEGEALLQFKELNLNNQFNCISRKRKMPLANQERSCEQSANKNPVDASMPKKVKSDNSVDSVPSTSTKKPVILTKHGVWDGSRKVVKRKVKAKGDTCDSPASERLKMWLKSAKTSTPVRPNKPCDLTYVVEKSPKDGSDSEHEGSDAQCVNATKNEPVSETSSSSLSSVKSTRFNSTTSSMLDAISEAYALGGNDQEVSERATVESFGSTRSSDNFTLYTAVDATEAGRVVLDASLMCTDEYDLVEAMNMDCNAVQWSFGSSRSSIDQALVSALDAHVTECVLLDAELACTDDADLFDAMNMELGSQPTEVNEVSQSCKNLVDSSAVDAVENDLDASTKCEVSARIWQQWVDLKTAKVSFKRMAENAENSVQLDNMVKRLKCVKLNDAIPSPFNSTIDCTQPKPCEAELDPAVPNSQTNSGTKSFNFSNQNLSKSCVPCDGFSNNPGPLEHALVDEMGSMTANQSPTKHDQLSSANSLPGSSCSRVARRSTL